MASAKATIDHDEIREWVESRGGFPAHVKRTGSSKDPGVLRIDYPGFSGQGSLERMDWDEFFEAFDANNLAFLYQPEGRSRFSKLVDRGTVEVSGGGGRKRAARRSTAKRPAARAASTKRTPARKAASQAKSTSKKSTKRASSTRSTSSKKTASGKSSRTATKKTAPSKSGARAASTRRTAGAKRTAAKSTNAKSSRKSTPSNKTASKKAASKRGTARKAAATSRKSTTGPASRTATTSRTSRSGVTTTNHDEIRQWVEARGGFPAHVKRTGSRKDPGVLRIDYPGFSGKQTLERMSWDDWFSWFDRDKLAFLYQDKQNSRFSKLVRR